MSAHKAQRRRLYILNGRLILIAITSIGNGTRLHSAESGADNASKDLKKIYLLQHLHDDIRRIPIVHIYIL